MKPQQNQSKQTQFNSSMTGVNPRRTHGFGVYKGRRVVWSVRVDETLLKQAKPLLRGKFGSDCRGVELWLAGLVATQKGSELTGVSPSNTVEIGTLVIERNIRTRRKIVVEEKMEVKVSCGFCGKGAKWLFENVDTKKQQYACNFHGETLSRHDKWLQVGEV